MATNRVNLDALIPREDFNIVSQKQFQRAASVKITDLEPDAFFYMSLRKPDFQRETANWEPAKIEELVRTFVDGDLVPAVILWGAGDTTFVIDGSHRLSALIAWVQDDYGDRGRSINFFEGFLPPEQIKAAKQTRNLIASTIGTYEEHAKAPKDPGNARPEVLERAKRLGSLSLQLQWVSAGDAAKAEASFFKINQSATIIDPTELKILSARASPNAIAARVIVRGGTGHKYWSAFMDKQREIEELGKEIHSLLFNPQLDTPIKTLDLPIAGRGYSGHTLPLIFDLVNLANDVPLLEKKGKSTPLPPDNDGAKTLSFLKNTRKLVNRMTGTNPASLGLHPVVYVYSATGRYQPTSFLALASFIKDLEKNNQLKQFTSSRRSFEDFIIAHKDFVNQVLSKFGSGIRGLPWIKEIYVEILKSVQANKNQEDIAKSLKDSANFGFLTLKQQSQHEKFGKFDKETKSATFLKEAIANPMRCNICHGLLHKNSMQIDHIERKREGGNASSDNAQMVHPYCNSTYKN